MHGLTCKAVVSILVCATAATLGFSQQSAAAAARPGIAPVADTYVVAEAPTTNYGAAIKLAASNWSTPWHSLAYLKFQIPAPPSGTVIGSARLDLVYQRTDHQAALTELRAVSDTGWSESAMTHQNRPAVGAVIATASPAQPGATTLSFDLGAAVTAPGTYSLAITNPTAESSTVVYSREQAADGPRLVLTYRKPLCGASFIQDSGETYQQALAREDTLFGGLKAARVFYGALPQAWPGKLDTGGRPMVISFKGNARDFTAGVHDAHMLAWFRNAPRDQDIYWSFYHEPEDNIRDGAFTAAEYRDAWRHLSGLARQAANPRLRGTLILMGWTLDPRSGRNWRDYYAGRDVIDVLAWDVYNTRADDGEYLDPASLFDRTVAVNRGENLPYGIAELGSHMVAGDTGAGRAAWLNRVITYLGDRGALWALYFDIDWSTGDYRLRDEPSVTSWRNFCAQL